MPPAARPIDYRRFDALVAEEDSDSDAELTRSGKMSFDDAYCTAHRMAGAIEDIREKEKRRGASQPTRAQSVPQGSGQSLPADLRDMAIGAGHRQGGVQEADTSAGSRVRPEMYSSNYTRFQSIVDEVEAEELRDAGIERRKAKLLKPWRFREENDLFSRKTMAALETCEAMLMEDDQELEHEDLQEAAMFARDCANLVDGVADAKAKPQVPRLKPTSGPDWSKFDPEVFSSGPPVEQVADVPLGEDETEEAAPLPREHIGETELHAMD